MSNLKYSSDGSVVGLIELTGSNVTLPTQEQSSREFVYVQPRAGGNLVLNSMSVGKAANLLDGFNQINDTASTYSYGSFRFTGRRVGILLGLHPTFGLLGFDVDGVDYGTYDCAKLAPANGVYNVPYVIATDLPDGEHVLTFTKVSAGSVSIQGFMVENSGNVQTFMRTGFNYHDMLDGNLSKPKAINTTDTTITPTDVWAHGITFTNTTASPINVTLKSNDGTLVGPLPVPANDVRQISGPIFFKASVKAVASAAGVFMILGGQ